MKVSYPQMGMLKIPITRMLTGIGIDVIETPEITKHTLEFGAGHSPEGVCLPYKITMGSLLESRKRGADTFVTVCGAGKCRLGFYHCVQQIDLCNEPNLQLFTINTDHLFMDLYRLLRKLAPHASRWAVFNSIVTAVKMLKIIDDLNEAKNTYGAQSHMPERAIQLFEEGVKQLRFCKDIREMANVKTATVRSMQVCAEQYPRKTVKVGIIGEFYMLLEPYANHRLEDALVKQGAEVHKFIHAGRWVYAQTLLKALGLYNEEKAYLKQARPYLNYHVGGDGAKSVGGALYCAQHGFDGMVHVYPFSCMPELVARYALKNISRDYQFPILYLSIDEHASDVGIMTRVEAFVDCLHTRKSPLG